MTKQIHMNWSGCRDWHDARSRVKRATGALTFGNFAEATGDIAEVRTALVAAGFVVTDMHPARGYAASFRLA